MMPTVRRACLHSWKKSLAFVVSPVVEPAGGTSGSACTAITLLLHAIEAGLKPIGFFEYITRIETADLEDIFEYFSCSDSTTISWSF